MSALKVVFFGDSLTECAHLPPEACWTALVAREAAEASRGRAELRFLVRAVCGDNTRQALERMQQEVQFEEPDVLHVQFGANDCDYWLSNRGCPTVSVEAFRANLREMAGRARAFGVRRLLFHTTHEFAKTRIDVNGRTHGQNLAPYNAAVREEAAAAGAVLVDVHALLRARDPASYTLPDGVHLNEEGCRLYAQAVGPALRRCLEELLAQRPGVPC